MRVTGLDIGGANLKAEGQLGEFSGRNWHSGFPHPGAQVLAQVLR